MRSWKESANLKRFIWVLIMPLALLASKAQAQSPSVSVLTQHNDNFRSGLNPNEVILTHANVNPAQFGKLFADNVDGFIVGQPLYVPGVNIGGTLHNVVYVATMHDSVYAFDADQNLGGPLWQVSFINPAAGITTVNAVVQGCYTTTQYTEIGIQATPVIDPATGTIYVLAKTLENGTYFHRLHALDIATGAEKFGGPVAIAATYTGPKGTLTFDPFRQLSRPALTLSDGIVYLAFGSNGCDGYTTGWVMGYDATSLAQLMVFDTAPERLEYANIWQGGAGLAVDADGNLYFATANGLFDVDMGGPDYGESLVKLSPAGGALSPVDYFTPYNHAALSAIDQDLGSGGVVILPDQPGPYPHLLVGGGKTGTIYLINRDNMGHVNDLTPNDSQIVQSIPGAMGELEGVPAFWNGNLYYKTGGDSVKEYTLSGGLLSTLPTSQSINKFSSSGSPSVSSNGNSNAIVWVVGFQSGFFFAYDATNLAATIYSNMMAGAMSRDAMPPSPHFVAPTIANGKVYVGTNSQLAVFGLLPTLSAFAGNFQSASLATVLPAPLQVKVVDAYSGNPVPGIPVAFSDGRKGGIFSTPTAITDATGIASTTYTLPNSLGTFAITGSSTGLVSTTFFESATAGPPSAISLKSGGGQKGAVATTLPSPFVLLVKDSSGHPVPGVVVNFSDPAGGSFSSNPATTGSNGQASVYYTPPNLAGSLLITATVTGLTPVTINATAVAGPATTLTLISGNHQSARPAVYLSSLLVVAVSDQYGNPEKGITVTFSDGGAGGTFNPVSAVTTTTGQASTKYLTPNTPGLAITITAASPGLSPVAFSESVSSPVATSLSVVSGGGQKGTVATPLPLPFVLLVKDSTLHPVPGIPVNFSDPSGGTFSSNPATTGSNGEVSVFYTPPTLVGSQHITATVPGLTPVTINVSSVAGPPANMTLTSGNNQIARPQFYLSSALVVTVTDVYGNPAKGIAVTFNDGGAGGTFHPVSPVTNTTTGQASTEYVTPNVHLLAITITATASGLTPVVFNESTN